MSKCVVLALPTSHASSAQTEHFEMSSHLPLATASELIISVTKMTRTRAHTNVCTHEKAYAHRCVNSAQTAQSDQNVKHVSKD